jgi:curved DNA-binding protein CbpA
MKNRRNYYRLLQVQPDAPVEIIRAAFRTLMLNLKRHPDLGGSSSEASELNEAYEVLADPARRAAYDKQLNLQYGKRAEAPERPPQIDQLCPICRHPLVRKPQPGDRCPTCLSPLQSERAAEHRRAYERASTRIRRSDKVFYHTVWPGKAQQGWMIDFSPQGMRFRCAENIPKGTVLKIRSELCDASGTVTNCCEESMDGQRTFAIGVAFLAVDFVEPKGSILSTSA